METKKEVMERLEKLAHHLVMSLEGMVRIGMIERDEAITHVVDVMNKEQKRVSELNDTQIALEMLSDMPPKIRQNTIEDLYKESFK